MLFNWAVNGLIHGNATDHRYDVIISVVSGWYDVTSRMAGSLLVHDVLSGT